MNYQQSRDSCCTGWSALQVKQRHCDARQLAQNLHVIRNVLQQV